MGTQTVIDIPSDQYDRFVELIGQDPEFPATYEGWAKQRDEKIRNLEAKGDVANVITVTYRHFTKYLEDNGFPPSFFALGAAALSTQHGQPFQYFGSE